MKTLIKLNRFSAWVLLFTIILYVISGFGMTKGIISSSLAIRLHISILSYILLVFFVYHSAFGVYLAFKRWGIWNRLGKTILILSILVFTFFFIYVDVFYVKNKNTPANIQSNPVNSEIQTVQSETTLTQAIKTAVTKTFTSSELAKYNGQNGQPAYVAVDGTVYDLSSVFRNGNHFGYSAGHDLSAEFHSQHDPSILSGFPIVGKLI